MSSVELVLVLLVRGVESTHVLPGYGLHAATGDAPTQKCSTECPSAAQQCALEALRIHFHVRAQACHRQSTSKTTSPSETKELKQDAPVRAQLLQEKIMKLAATLAPIWL